jgi:uncharacterized integral membrane protein
MRNPAVSPRGNRTVPCLSVVKGSIMTDESQYSAFDPAAPPPSSTSIPAPPQRPQSRRRAARTRSGSLYVGLIVTAVVLILLLIFIGQNSRTVTVHYLGLHGRMSLAAALLLSAIAGVVLVAVPALVRTVQLNRALRKALGSRKDQG